MNPSRSPLPLALGLLLAGSALAEPIRRASYPAISPDGATLLFSWQGDIWSQTLSGSATKGEAVRLTVHNATDTRPVWYPDGSRVAFASSRGGNYAVYTMRPDGSDLKRVTYDAGTQIPTAVSADGRTIYGQTSSFGRGDLFRVAATGGDLVRLTDHPLETAYLAKLSPDEKTVYYNRGAYRETSWQKPGTLSASLPEVWAADNTVPLTNHRKLTENDTTDLTPLPAPDGSITFISNKGGWPNVWRANREMKSPKQLTLHKDGTSRNPSITKDGRYVAYEFESDLYLLDTRTGADTKLAVETPADSRYNPKTDVTVKTASAFEVSPDARRTVFESRGDLFLTLERGGPTRRLTTNPSVDTEATWLDSNTILYVASEGGKRVIKKTDAQGNATTWKSDARDLLHPMVSPDGKSVLYQVGGETLMVANADGTGAKTILRANLQGALDDAAPYAWSPDSEYVAVDKIQGRRREISLVDVATGKETVVGHLVFKPQTYGGQAPVWLPNGRGLLVFSGEYETTDLFLIDLVPDDETYVEDELDNPSGKAGAKPEKPKADPVSVQVYEPGILQRLRRLTTTGAGAAAVSPDSKTIYVATDDGIQALSTKTGRGTTVVAGRVSDLAVRGGKLYWLSRGALTAMSLSGPPSPSEVKFTIDYAVDNHAEETALFEDVWWAIDRLYYDAKLNNKDWPAIKAKYAALVPYAYDRQDFYRMMGEMMEELDSSHLGATSPPAPDWGTGDESPAFTGFDLDPKALMDGRYVIGRTLPNTPATAPDAGRTGPLLRVGDRILRVNGVEPSGEHPMSELLDRKAGEKLTLKIERNGVKSTVTMKPDPGRARTDAEYENFVMTERALTDRLSGGKLGYLHIRAMDAPSLQRFLREIRTEAEGKKGVIVDVRFNGGGSTAVDILGVLIRTPWLIRTTRGEFGTKLSENIYRADGLELPTALMINTASFSNAEVIAEGWRKLNLGPIVGEPTPGYVIGTGAYRLWDGGFIRLPAIGAYEVSGKNLEGVGRKPDVTVWYDPNAWLAGRDPQLEKTVAELLRSAAEKK